MKFDLDQLKQRITGKFLQIKEMKQVEELIQEKFSSDANRLTEIASYLLNLGGKRMRPALNLLIGQMLGCASENRKSLIEISAGIELIHMATLLHDDIIDNSGFRRHKESPFKKFGLGDSLLCGDFLLTRAFSLCAHLDPYIIEATEKACIYLTEGEILELPMCNKMHTIESSILIAKKKTAALFALAAETAGFICQLELQDVQQLYEFGERLGIAFQIVDDILDVVSTKEVLGKEPGIDIRERKPSIINVLWLKSGDPLAQKLLMSPAIEHEDLFITEALEVIRASSVIAQAKLLAEEKMQEAAQILVSFDTKGLIKDQSAYDTIQLIMDYVLKRLD